MTQQAKGVKCGRAVLMRAWTGRQAPKKGSPLAITHESWTMMTEAPAARPTANGERPALNSSA
jgi:hypothetical protein